VGQVGLAEAGGGGEVDAGRGRQGKGERVIRGRGRFRVCAVFETWAEGSPGHSQGRSQVELRGRDKTGPWTEFSRGFLRDGRLGGVTTGELATIKRSVVLILCVLASGI
jgi:hypothetical protein